MSEAIGFIGLGHMGEPMARNLLQAGFRVRVYNRTAAKARALVGDGAQLVTTPADTIEPGGTVITMVAHDAALEEIVLGENGIGRALGPGGVHLSMSTVSPNTTRKLALWHAEHGSTYLAAPVFGRPEAAAARKLWICISGPTAAKQTVQPVLEALSQGVHDFGEEADAANVVKLAGNFLILSAIEALAEAFALGEKNHVDRGALANFFGQTIFACPIYQNYGRIVATEQFTPPGFTLALGMKDVKLVLGTAEESEVPMPLASLLHDRLLASLAKGRQALDWTSLAISVSENAGLR